MSDLKRFLAYDLGASSGRAIVGTLENKKLRIEELHRFSNGPTTLMGSMYWDILKLFDEMRVALGLYARKYGAELHGIGFDTWGVDFGLLDKNGLLICNPFHYRDHRTDGMVEELCRHFPREEVFARTGIQFMQLNTLFQLYAMAVQQSPLFEISDTLLLFPALLMYFFSGRKVNEFTHATTTQMLNPGTGEWDYEMLKALGIPTEILKAEIVQPGTIVGDLLPELAEPAGLGRVPVIATASHDTASAVAAVPTQGGEWAYLSSGTWSLLGLEVAEPIISDASLQYNLTNEGGVGGSYRFLKNIMGLWLVQECKRIWDRDGKTTSFAELMLEAERAAPFKAVIDPNDTSFLNPSDMPKAIVEFCRATGQSVPESRGEILRCALESLALKYRHVLEKMEQLRGKSIDVLHIVGGGIQNTLLCQFTANATGKAVVAGPVEATAIGNIMVQALATGDIGSLQEGRQIIRQSYETVCYAAQDTERWETVYERSRELLERSW
ncbi:rhamnulokinase [candidate division KSB3 bacterium]|uniref:Rhamnulokinase n=1 Tax=candidate division KSB3 bacterium TaxID=2044937 RepID=A0A2G6E485_9BACT|nr:MAG: rhamnulokinase [candidate division KSB3 bacterium]PIE29339.1 MAG: rhamnulokinase [candidate division KSB3 bacterium]